MNSSDPDTSKKAFDWSLRVMAGFVAYMLSVGPAHGLYYNDKLPEESGELLGWVYYPIAWIEERLPGGEPIHTYKYWWYINMKYPRFPPRTGPP